MSLRFVNRLKASSISLRAVSEGGRKGGEGEGGQDGGREGWEGEGGQDGGREGWEGEGGQDGGREGGREGWEGEGGQDGGREGGMERVHAVNHILATLPVNVVVHCLESTSFSRLNALTELNKRLMEPQIHSYKNCTLDHNSYYTYSYSHYIHAPPSPKAHTRRAKKGIGRYVKHHPMVYLKSQPMGQ